MSRTDKHRPYWVKTNDQGIEHHDHSKLGEEVWRKRMVVDAERKPIIEVVTTYAYADDYLRSIRRDIIGDYSDRDQYGNRLWFFGHLGRVSYRKPGLIHSDAYRAVNEGDPKRLIEVGTHSQRKFEYYHAYTIPNECTIGMRHDAYGNPTSGRGVYPCYMEANWASDRSVYACSCSYCNPGVDYGSVRRKKREMLGKAKRNYNSGDENWFDCMDGDDITPSRKTYRAW